MSLMSRHDHMGTKNGSLKLHVLRKGKSDDSYTLKRLLEDHRRAKCLDPRDKIYGLVGLASDAAGFPIDYEKSLYEVWKDTMEFMNRWGLFKDEAQILPTGALVKSLLMVDSSEPVREISTAYEDVDSMGLIDKLHSSQIFHLLATAQGCVVCLGPSPTDIIAKPSKTSEWNIAIQQTYQAEELTAARRESDDLLEALLEQDDAVIEKMCFDRASTVVWKDFDHFDQHSPPPLLEYSKGILRGSVPITFDRPELVRQTDQPRLYLSKSDLKASQKMGLASGHVELGDLVCWVRSSRRALLVRIVNRKGRLPKDAVRARVFGTALATEDMCGPVMGRRYPMEEGRGYQFEIQVDAETIFLLLA